MAKYRFGDIVKEVKINVNRDNNPYEFYVAGDHMDSEDLIIRRKGRFSTDDVGPAFTRIFHPGQVLYGSRRTYLKKVAIADFDGICANTTFVLETKDNNIFTQELLPFIMLSDRFTEWSVSHSKGSTNPYVLFSDLADFEIELPDINSQRSLAKKLASAHNVKESYKTLLKCTDELVKSQFIEMFGTPASNELGLPTKYLNEISNNLDSKRIPITSGNRKEGPYPYYGASGIVDYVADYIFDETLLLISEDGANLKDRVTPIAFTASGKYWVNNHAHILRFKDISLHNYVEHFINYLNVEKYLTGMAQPKLNQDRLNAIPVNMPSSTKIAKFHCICKQADKSKQIAFSRAS